MGDSIIKNANNKAEITMREASVKAAHIVEEARKKVEDEKDELIRVQTRCLPILRQSSLSCTGNTSSW